MLWAQITILVFQAIGLLYAANQHGKEKSGKENFWRVIIGAAIFATILYFAGAYSKIFH